MLCETDCVAVWPATQPAPERPLLEDWPGKEMEELLMAIPKTGIERELPRRADDEVGASSVLVTPRWPSSCPATVRPATAGCWQGPDPYYSTGIRW